MRVGAPMSRSKLSLDDAKRIVDHAAANGFAAVSLTGGEPLLHIDEIVEVLRHAGRAGIRFLRTGTNGFLLRAPGRKGWRDRAGAVAEKLAGTPLRNLWISLDSADPDSHDKLRGLPGVSEGIEKSLPIFHGHGIYPAANLGLNRYLGGMGPGSVLTRIGADGGKALDGECERFLETACRGLSKFIRRAVDMGFTMMNMCYPMSCEPYDSQRADAAYAAISSDLMIRFSPLERSLLLEAVRRTVPRFRSEIRVFSPLSSIRALIRSGFRNVPQGGKSRSFPCRGGADFFFVDAADCQTYACGYRSSPALGKFWDLDLSRPPLPADCRSCDWECFRDPSELLGPFSAAVRSPLGLLRRLLSARAESAIWRNDLRYYLACGLFDGRGPPDPGKLQAFGRKRTLREAETGMEVASFSISTSTDSPRRNHEDRHARSLDVLEEASAMGASQAWDQ